MLYTPAYTKNQPAREEGNTPSTDPHHVLYDLDRPRKDPEIQARIDTLRMQRERWDARYQAYLVQRDAILNSTYSKQIKLARINTLRASHFQGNDWRRVSSLDINTLAALDVTHQ